MAIIQGGVKQARNMIGSAGGSVQMGTFPFSSKTPIVPADVQNLVSGGNATANIGNLLRATCSAGTSVSVVMTTSLQNNFQDGLIELINGGLATVSFSPAPFWVLPDGTTTTVLATYLTAIGRAGFQSAGRDFIYWWVDGTLNGSNVNNIFAKIV